jgi:uncharacterized SAM-binding protein YcdF (DUF218 family)
MIKMRQYIRSLAWVVPYAQKLFIRLKPLLLVGGAMLGLIGGTIQILTWIGAFLIVQDTLQPADALVPLAGEPTRVIYAQQLFEQEDIQWFVITNMYVASAYIPGIDFYVYQTQQQAIDYGVPPDRILLNTHTVASTHQEAEILRRIAQEQDWQTLIVVTSPPHTRRASIIFRDVFRNTEVQIIMQSVEGHWYTPHSWWKMRAGWNETLLEYAKLLHYWFVGSLYERNILS